MPVDAQSLSEQSSCFLCFGATGVEALELALLAEIVNGGVTPPVEDMAYTIQFFSSGNNSMAAGTSYFYGMMSTRTINTVYAIAQIDIPKTGTIKRVQYKVDISTTLGTAGQLVSHSVRINDTTDVGTLAFDYSATPISMIDAAVNAPVVVGDTVSFKIATPAVWTTPATNCRVCCMIYIE